MSKRPWFPFYTGDYTRKTRHLTAEQKGCYVDLMCFYWDNNGNLPNDPSKLCRIMGIERRAFNRVWGDLKHFFVHQVGQDGDTLLQERLQEELEKTIEISKVKAKAGKKGGEANAKAKNEHMPTHSHSHSHKEHSVNKLTAQDEPEKELTFWDIGESIGIPRSLIGQACSKHPETAVAKAIATTQIKKPADPKAFFKGLLRNNPQTGAQPDWQRMPLDDNKLEAWAVRNGFRRAYPGEEYPQYRGYLSSAVTLRKDKAA